VTVCTHGRIDGENVIDRVQVQGQVKMRGGTAGRTAGLIRVRVTVTVSISPAVRPAPHFDPTPGAHVHY